MVWVSAASDLNFKELSPGAGLGTEREVIGFAEIQIDVALLHHVHAVSIYLNQPRLCGKREREGKVKFAICYAGASSLLWRCM